MLTGVSVHTKKKRKIICHYFFLTDADIDDSGLETLNDSDRKKDQIPSGVNKQV